MPTTDPTYKPLWTDGYDLPYEGAGYGVPAHFVYASQHEKFPMISREAFYADCKAHGVDIYVLTKLTLPDGSVRKFHASDFGWLEVPPEGPQRTKKPKPFHELVEAA